MVLPVPDGGFAHMVKHQRMLVMAGAKIGHQGQLMLKNQHFVDQLLTLQAGDAVIEGRVTDQRGQVRLVLQQMAKALELFLAAPARQVRFERGTGQVCPADHTQDVRLAGRQVEQEISLLRTAPGLHGNHPQHTAGVHAGPAVRRALMSAQDRHVFGDPWEILGFKVPEVLVGVDFHDGCVAVGRHVHLAMLQSRSLAGYTGKR